MKDTILAILLVIAAVTATAQEDTFKGKTIVVIGDSYVRNHRRPMKETWHARVAERLGMNYRNYGRNGNSIAFDRSKQGFGRSMLERYQEMTDTADFVLVIAGHNDAFSNDFVLTRDDMKVLRQTAAGIEEINNSSNDTVMYDLNGRRITCPVHGLNIINAKKVFIK